MVSVVSRKTLWCKHGLLLSVMVFLVYSLAVTSPVHAAGNTITITARVAPTRIIIVDARGTIQRIISNTTEFTRPAVYTTDNTSVPMTSDIQQQYDIIASHRNLNKVGVVYAIQTIPPKSHFAFLFTIFTSVYLGHL